MSRIRFHHLAEAELYDSAHYYEKQAIGLGNAFLDEVWRTIEHALENPAFAPLISSNVRRKVLNRFPYSLLYRFEEDDTLFVLAIMHQQRRPNYWLNRISAT